MHILITVISKKVTYHLFSVNAQTLRGLIYYLKVPKDKPSQEKRFKEIMEWKP